MGTLDEELLADSLSQTKACKWIDGSQASTMRILLINGRVRLEAALLGQEGPRAGHWQGGGCFSLYNVP